MTCRSSKTKWRHRRWKAELVLDFSDRRVISSWGCVCQKLSLFRGQVCFFLTFRTFIVAFVVVHITFVPSTASSEMHDSFWLGVEINNFLFYGFNIKSWEVMLATCIGTATYSLFLVALTFTKEMLIHKASAQRQGQAIVSQSHILEVWTSTWKMHIVQGLLNLIQLSSGYFLMLIVMTYNVYLCISVLIGSSIGYYLFNPYLKQKRVLQTQKTQDPAAEIEESGALLNPRDPYQPAIVSSLNSPDSGQISVVSANVHQSIYS